MKKHIFLVFFLVCVTAVLVGNPADKDKTGNDKKLPEVGSTYMLDGAKFIVRGVGNRPFEYTATGESLVIKIFKISGTMVIVPKKGDKVRVDPTIPMVWVGGKAKSEFSTNSYLKKNGRNAVFLLLEYDRSKR